VVFEALVEANSALLAKNQRKIRLF